MLACTHDLFFNNDYNTVTSYSSHLSQNTKDKDEQVWPPDVESAFIQALETIPKLGRRKILVNGKPCGRNELISDFIFRQTGKLRTRKQVSSHIQVLKNTRKNDPHFMRLLTDVSQESDMAIDPLLNHVNNNNLMYCYPPPQYNRSASTLPSTKEQATTPALSSLTMSSAASDWMMFYDSPASMLPITNTSAPVSSSSYVPFQPLHMTTNHINPINDIIGLHSDISSLPSTYYGDNCNNGPVNNQPVVNQHLSSYCNDNTQLQHIKGNLYWAHSAPKLPLHFRLWPNYTRFYLEYPSPVSNTVVNNDNANNNKGVSLEGSSTVCTQVISQGCCQEPQMLPIKNPCALQLKCPWQDLHHLLTRLPPSCPFLYNQVSLDIQLNAILDYSIFQNTSLFQSYERRTLECITTVYSFGARVLETKETQLPQTQSVSAQSPTKLAFRDKQAGHDEYYTYNFSFINPFFDAFLKGIRSLSSWDEINAAINNLCVIQVFEDYNTKEPLLAVLFDFNRDITPEQQGMKGSMNLTILAQFQEGDKAPSSPLSIKIE